MQVVRKLSPSSGSTVLTLGFFDGIHSGHTAIFNRILDFKKQNPYFSFTLCTFEAPPVSIIKKISAQSLFTLEERLDCFKNFKVDTTYLLPMTESFFNTSALDFIKELVQYYNKVHLIIGEEARFGKDQKGGFDFFKEVKTILGDSFSFETIPIIQDRTGEKISSTPLRQNFQKGELSTLNSVLYKPIFLKGEVIHGEKRGRLIGFPTLNILYPSEKILPPLGVYKSFTVINQVNYHSLTYISTFRLDTISQTPISETWVLSFDKEIYGETVTTYLLDLQRPPIKVGSLEELKLLLEQDKKTTS